MYEGIIRTTNEAIGDLSIMREVISDINTLQRQANLFTYLTITPVALYILGILGSTFATLTISVLVINPIIFAVYGVPKINSAIDALTSRGYNITGGGSTLGVFYNAYHFEERRR